MKVTLVGLTQPMNIENARTAEDLLSYCARVSNTANQQRFKTGPQLLRSLMKRGEWSPLEMVDAVMEVETTRDIARQMLRHRSFSFQEFSQRYAEPSFDNALRRETRMEHPTDRQSSLPVTDPRTDIWFQQQQGAILILARRIYEEARHKGIAKEQARVVLPEGLTFSRLYMKGSLRSWVHYFQLRCDPKTQREHQLVAEACKDALFEHFKTSLKYAMD